MIVFFLLIQISAAANLSYYLDVRWDDVETYAANPTTVPFDHGLRIVPAFYVARQKLMNGMELIPPPTGWHLNYTAFYAAYGVYGLPFVLRNSSDGMSYVGPHDIGFCYYFHTSCKDHVIDFTQQKFLADDESINFVFPNFTEIDYSSVTSRLSALSEATLDDDLSGILGSTDAAYLSATVSKGRGIPNIVTHVTDSYNLWPMDPELNHNDALLDNSLIIGYDPYVITDQLIDLIRIGVLNGSLQIIHEGGYNRILANQIIEQFPTRFPIIVPAAVNGEFVTAENILVDETNYYTYGLEADEAAGTKAQMTSAELNTLVSRVPGRGRFVVLMGKRKMFRDILTKFFDQGMKPADYVIILMPENGGPCPSFWESQGSESSARDNDIKSMLEGQFTMCHNGHNRIAWNDPYIYDYGDGYKYYRYYGYPPIAFDMSKWDNFTAEFRDVAKNLFGYDIPADEEISALAAYAHDSVLWAAFLDMMRKENPEWFLDDQGYTQERMFQMFQDEYKWLELFYPHNNFGWKGMFGNDHNNLISGCCGFIVQNIMTSDYVFKNNRIQSDALAVTVFADGEWQYYTSYYWGKGIIGIWAQMYNLVSVAWVSIVEDECGYDNELCAARRRIQILVTSFVVGGIAIIFTIIFGSYFLVKRLKYNKQVGAMMWRLDYDSIDFDVSGVGIRSSMMGTRGGTMGTVGTAGTKGTRGGDTMHTMGTMGGTKGLGTKGTMGTQGTNFTIATFQTLGTNLTAGTDAGNRKDQIFAKLAVLRAKRCAVKDLDDEWSKLCTKTPNINLLKEMKEITDISHDNVVNFYGICYTEAMDHPVALIEYCARGSLQDLLEDEDTKLDNNFKFSFIIDLVRGMKYLHSSHLLKRHGYLKSTNCLITAQFGLKVSDYGEVMFLNDAHRVSEMENIARNIRQLSRSPELLRLEDKDMPLKGTKQGDVYSCGIIMHEIMQREGPYGTSSDDCVMSAGEILDLIKKPPMGKPYRPSFGLSTDDKIQIAKGIAEHCWDENVNARPDFNHVANAVLKLQDEDLSLIQRIVMRMEKFVKDMEKLRRGHEHNKEKNINTYRTIQQQFLPDSLIEKITVGADTPPETHNNATVLSMHITGYNEALSKYPEFESDIWASIDHSYSGVSVLAKQRGFFLLRSDIGKFVIIANTTQPCPNHTSLIYNFVDEFKYFLDQSIDLVSSIKEMITVKSGISTGPLVTAVVPGHYPRLQVYGETVTVSEALGNSATGSQCLVSDSAQCQLSSDKNIKFEKCTTLKHKDLLKTAVYSAVSV